MMSNNENNMEVSQSSNSDNGNKLKTNFLLKPLKFEKLPFDPDTLEQVDFGFLGFDKDGNMYSFSDTINSKQLTKLNVLTNTWTETTGTPHEYFMLPGVVFNDGRLIVFGGVLWDLNTASNEVSVCDLATLQWKNLKRTTGPKPATRCISTMVAQEDNLYVVGGYGPPGVTYMDIHKFNLGTSTWESLWTQGGGGSPNGREPQDSLGNRVAIYGNKIIFFGVKNYLGTNNLSKIPAFDLTSMTWTCLDTIGDSSSSTGSAFPSFDRFRLLQKEGHAFICGSDSSHGIWKLNLIDLQWTKLPISYPDKLTMYDVVLSPNGCLFVVLEKQSDEKSMWKCWLSEPTEIY